MKLLRRYLVASLTSIAIALTILFSSACGYLLYPERRGMKKGKIDPFVVVLDAAWCLVFIVPGVVAFVVDVMSGGIYLTPGTRSTLGSNEPIMVPVPPGELTQERVAEVVRAYTGEDISFDDPRLVSTAMEREAALGALTSTAGRTPMGFPPAR